MNTTPMPVLLVNSSGDERDLGINGLGEMSQPRPTLASLRLNETMLFFTIAFPSPRYNTLASIQLRLSTSER